MGISFNNVKYGQIIENLNVNFQAHKINGIIGKSGSGKTTLIEMIDALRLPTSGEIIVDNVTIHSKFKMKQINDFRVNIGLVYEFPEEQFFNNTVREELSFALKYFDVPSGAIDERLKNALEQVGLDSTYLNRDPFTLSHGEKRKVAIASILVFNPNILIIDEPTLGLDGKSQNQIISLIKTLQIKSKKTIIIVSQNSELIYSLCDHIYLMHKGKIVFDAKKYDFFTKEEIKQFDIKIPKLVSFVDKVKQKKGINLGYRDDINDLIKDIYRYVK